MAIGIRQESTPATPKRWHWAIWLEGPADELDQIARVVYQLHPTFTDPVRASDERHRGFRIEGSAWGEFMVHLSLEYRDGGQQDREHWLKLGPDAPSKIAEALQLDVKGRSPTVFLSASLADVALSAKVKQALRRHGITVLSQDDLPVGSAWNSELHSMIQSADLGLAVISRETSPWVASEVTEMRHQHTPVIPLLVGEDSDLPEGMRDLQALRIHDDEASADTVADQVVDLLPKRAP